MNKHKNQPPASHQPIISVDPAPLSTNSPPPPPELEISFGELTPHQQAMVEQSVNQHLAEALYEKKAGHAAEGMVRFALLISNLFVEVNFQLDVTEARAAGRPNEGRISEFVAKQRDRLERNLGQIDEQLANRLITEAGKSVYPKPKGKGDNGSLLNIRLFTVEVTETKQEPDPDERLPMAATFFGNRID